MTPSVASLISAVLANDLVSSELTIRMDQARTTDAHSAEWQRAVATMILGYVKATFERRRRADPATPIYSPTELLTAAAEVARTLEARIAPPQNMAPCGSG